MEEYLREEMEKVQFGLSADQRLHLKTLQKLVYAKALRQVVLERMDRRGRAATLRRVPPLPPCQGSAARWARPDKAIHGARWWRGACRLELTWRELTWRELTWRERTGVSSSWRERTW